MKTEAALPLTTTHAGWLLAAGLAGYLPLARHVPPWLAAIAACLFLWRALLVWRQAALPGRWLLVLLTLAGTAGVLLQYGTLFGQQAGVALLLLFLALKQLETRSPRDGLAIVLLVYFLALAQFFDDQSIVAGATTFGTVLVATTALLSLNDRRSAPLALLKFAGVLLLQALPLMLILFLLFPRVPGPLWGLPSDAYSGLTGLTDSMAPGSINNLIQSEEIAFRVQFDGPPPERKDLYWRGPVLTHLEGRTWRASERASRQATQTLPYRLAADSPRFRYSLTLEAHNRPWLFALEFPAELPPESFVTADFQLHAPRPVRDRRRYTLESHPHIIQLPERPAVLREALALPADLNPRTQALGQGWRAEGGDNAHRLERAIDFMRDQRLIYTLRPPLTGDDVADDFLFSTRRGFCEHFAASFVVLMRAAGVPARVVTGYQGGERNPVDGTYVIRQSDAHAWAEVWLDDRGWTRVDPTALSNPARIEQNLAAAVPAGDPLPLLARRGFEWLRDIRFRWWAVENAWNQWVLGFNTQRQREFLRKFGMPDADWRSMGIALGIFFSLTLALLALLLLYRRNRLDPAERLWRTLCRRLARRGLARQPWEGPRDYAERIAAAMPEQAERIRDIAALYAALRYGRPAGTDIRELSRRIAVFQP